MFVHVTAMLCWHSTHAPVGLSTRAVFWGVLDDDQPCNAGISSWQGAVGSDVHGQSAPGSRGVVFQCCRVKWRYPLRTDAAHARLHHLSPSVCACMTHRKRVSGHRHAPATSASVLSTLLASAEFCNPCSWPWRKRTCRQQQRQQRDTQRSAATGSPHFLARKPAVQPTRSRCCGPVSDAHDLTALAYISARYIASCRLAVLLCFPWTSPRLRAATHEAQVWAQVLNTP